MSLRRPRGAGERLGSSVGPQMLVWTRNGWDRVRAFFDLLLIASLVAWALPFALRHGVSPMHVAMALLGLVLLMAVGRTGGSLSRLVRTTFRIALPVVAIWGLAITYGGDAWPALLGPLLTLVLALFGFYLMFAGAVGSDKQRRRK